MSDWEGIQAYSSNHEISKPINETFNLNPNQFNNIWMCFQRKCNINMFEESFWLYTISAKQTIQPQNYYIKLSEKNCG